MHRSQENDTRRRPSRQRAVTAGLGVLALLGLTYAVKIIGNAPEVSQGADLGDGLHPAAVYVQPVKQVMAQHTATVTGSIRATARAEVAAREQGAVLEVLVDEGDAVAENAILARLDDRRSMALLGEARASLTAARSLVLQRTAELARAKEDLGMKRGLLQRKAVSKSDILDAERLLAVTQAQHDAAHHRADEARSRVAFLEVQVEDMVIRAPFAGVVVQRQVELGEWVDAGSIVATVVQTAPIEAWLRVPTRYRQGVQETPDNLRILQSATGHRFQPTEVALIPDVEPLSQLFTVVATLDNGEGKLTAGESITGIVPVDLRAPHWQFPTDALNRTATGVYVYGIADDGTAKRIPVSVDFEQEGHAYVSVEGAALQSQDSVVVEGNERLQPGQAMIIRERSGTAETEVP